MRHEEYSPRHDLADRLRNRFDVESYDVYEFHGDNNGDPDAGASDDQTSVSGAAGASTSLPDCAPDDPACHRPEIFQMYGGYPYFNPAMPPGYPAGPAAEPDKMGGEDGFGWQPAPPVLGGGGYGGQPRGVFNRIRNHFRALGGQPQPPYGGGGMPGIGQPQPPGMGMGQQQPPPFGPASWQRWQQVHPGSQYSDYMGWWQQNGVNGATINGEVSFGGEGSLGDEDLCGGFDMKG
jgi:hypothetical protein